ncbi:NAD-dependent epimerase/dehydratase family protein [Streptomyces sp. NPDC102283]|uniref:NAD-dependent epimerase/dehydratase family protein n=1 Tax=Streptomyces sp. NPDC102283 TaxID=3366155 RepID=UPI00380F9EF6
MSARVVLVLGGGGFLGGHVGAAFTAAGRTVRSAGRADATSARLPGLLAAVRPDVVVNAAGSVWDRTEQQMREDNTRFPERLLSALTALRRPPRLVHLGSVHEYGPTPSGVVLTEDHPAAPVGPYGRTKLAGTRAVLGAFQEGALDGVVLRVSNVFGPAAPAGSLVGSVAGRLREVRDAGSRGAPHALRLAPLVALRDFVDVRDVADAVLAAATASGCSGQIVNIGAGRPVRVRELVLRMVEFSGLDVAVVEDRPADRSRGAVSWQQIDVSRAARTLGWRPRIGLDRSLTDTLAAALSRPAPHG